MPVDTGLLSSVLEPARLYEPLFPEVVIRSQPEDFRVDEIPLYELSGEGEHLFLTIEKRNVAAGHLIKILSRTSRVSSRDIGVAGQKDKRAVTRQLVSLPASSRPNVASLVDGSVRVLDVAKHGNKLRTGHLQGNRFEIVLRPAAGASFGADDVTRVRSRLLELQESGFPNYFGRQRFGIDGHTIAEGINLLQSSASSKRRGTRFVNKMAVSAVQSAVFNCVLSERVRDRSFHRPISGDIVCRRGGTKPFVLPEGDTADAETLLPMGPMPGPKMLLANGRPAELEAAALEQLNVTVEDFAKLRKIAPGTRRQMVAFPENVDATATEDGGLLCRFTLASGSYATVLLAEVAGSLRE